MIERAARRRVEQSEQQCPRDRESRAISPRRKREDRLGRHKNKPYQRLRMAESSDQAVLAQAAGVERG
jgi:hypothetical protein